MRKHLFGAVLAGLALRLFLVWRYPMVAGDTAIYEQLARNWLDHGVYGLWLSGHLTPVDLRAPGYPAFLAAIFSVFGRSQFPVMAVQAFVDLLTCLLTGAIAAWLAPHGARARVAVAAVWLAALCPFVANYAATPLTEVLATFLTTAAISFLLAAVSGRMRIVDTEGPRNRSTSSFAEDLTADSLEVVERTMEAEEAAGFASNPRLPYFLAGFIVGLGTLVRPETPLLLAAVGLVLTIRWWRPRDWPRLLRAGTLMALGLVLPLLPWAARNYLTLGEVQFLAPRHAELPGELVPHGFYAWTNTWLVRFRDVYLVPWKLEDEPIPVEGVNPAAFDSPQERARVAALLKRYNEETVYTAALDAEFAALARERASRHPARTYVWIPLQRAATMWFTPRIELLPYSGQLWPLAEKWDEDREDFLVTLSFGLLNFLFVGLALAGAWALWRTPVADTQSAAQWGGPQLGLWIIVAFVAVRTAFLTQVETPEPRYVVVCFPAVLALAAQLWSRRHGTV